MVRTSGDLLEDRSELVLRLRGQRLDVALEDEEVPRFDEDADLLEGVLVLVPRDLLVVGEAPRVPRMKRATRLAYGASLTGDAPGNQSLSNRFYLPAEPDPRAALHTRPQGRWADGATCTRNHTPLQTTAVKLRAI